MSREILSRAMSETISGQDLGDARVFFEKEIQQLLQKLTGLGDKADLVEVAKVKLEIARARLGMGEHEACWQEARPLVKIFIEGECFQQAVEACELLYLSEQDESIAALGQACWLAVAYPVEPALSVDMLSYIIDETPDNSDGAAVASVAALYIAELRSKEEEKESLMFLAKQLIAMVAKRHRGIEDEGSIEIWIEMLELNNLDEMFTRLGKVIDAIVGDNWWFDRDELRAKLPVN
tara:strand:+ start:204 stop:911 length:708 start_codon:yes stop_codon:yes gene_type:complete